MIGLDLKNHTRSAAGIGRYSIQLVGELVARKHFDYLGFAAPQLEPALLPKGLPLAEGSFNQVKSTLLRSLWYLPRALRQSPVRVFHSMDFSIPGWGYSAPCKRIATVHDMIVWKYPEFFTKKHVLLVKEMTRQSLLKADRIITDSVCSKQDILSYFPRINDQKIIPIPLAASNAFQKRATQKEQVAWRKKRSLPSRYFLSVGTNEPRKNLDRLIQAFLCLKQKTAFQDMGLVLIGGKGWLSQGKTGEEFISKGIHALGFLPENELSLAYSSALAFVYPSLYEGFGLPVLEAMSIGVPVITSGVSSLPEVGGDAVCYVDPLSVQSLQNTMERLAEQPDLCKELGQKCLKRASEFSWSKTAEQTESVYAALV